MSHKNKSKVREDIRKKLKKQPLFLRRKRSFEIGKKFLRSEEFKTAKVIFFYVSLPTEVDTKVLIDKALRLKKTVVVPLVRYKERKLVWYKIKNRKRDLKPGILGILEPDPQKTKKWPEKHVDLVVVPGLAFDRKLNRLGQGAGFYDRFLRKIYAEVPKIGLAFSCQIIKKVPIQKHDARLNKVITNSK